MPALPETIFDIFYLLFAVVSGIIMLTKAKENKLLRLFGCMTLILGLGDSFHLVPRMLNYWFSGDYTAALGIGKLVTSVTMTVFYLILEYARRERYGVEGEKPVLASVWALSIIRIALCAFPQNGWTSAQPSLVWGIIRNIPFAVLGLLTVILWFKSAKRDKPFRFMWLAVTLSFLFYIPVVLWAQQIPIIGMLMLPKTCMYVWMILMFRRADK
ncbi:MAG: hypothetical protein IJ725_06290 [Ruminococcus sp.]|nr:hypothetical protein [Ruminococcus sp.]